MSKTRLPEESESQEIGQHAVISFNSNYPTTWRVTATDGDSDVGLDFQVQLTNDNLYSGLFHAQIKGSRQTKNGKNKALNSDQSFFSVPLSIKTLNYYLTVESPVILVFVDLTSNDNIRECNIYYKWIDEELIELQQGEKSLDHLQKGTHTFRVPIENVFNAELDVLPYLQDRQKRKFAFQTLYSSIPNSTGDPTNIVSKLGQKFSASKISLASIIQETDNPWIDAPDDSFAGLLKNSHDSLSFNALPKALNILKKTKKRLKEANRHERAEYLYQYGLYYSKIGLVKKAKFFYSAAHETLPGNKKYHTAFLQNKFHFIIDRPDICASILSSIEEKESFEYADIKAKLLSLLKKHDDALNLLKNYPEKKTIVLQAIVYLTKRDYQGVIKICDKGISKLDLKETQEFTLLSLRARAKFNIGSNFQNKDDTIIPFSGYPDMEVSLLKDAYDDILKAFRIGKILNYPSDIEYMIDIASVLFLYFNDAEYFYSYLKRFCDIHTRCEPAKALFLELSQKLCKTDAITELLRDLPDTPENTIHEIIFEYNQKNKPMVVELAKKHYRKLLDSKAPNSDVAFGTAAQCAKELLMKEELDLFIDAIKEYDTAEIILSIYNYITSINENLLTYEEAINNLYRDYKKYNFDNLALTQLFHALRPDKTESARNIIEVTEDIQKIRDFDLDEYHRLLTAHATLKNWRQLLEISTNAIYRFGNEPRLVVLKSLALDMIGNTPEAISELARSVDIKKSDPYVLDIYTQICMRVGLIEEAANFVNESLSKTNERDMKLNLLKQLFSIELYRNRCSPRLYEICKKYGKLVNQEDETEEGLFLQQCLLSTLHRDVKIEQQFADEFKIRSARYHVKFPNSPILKMVNLDLESGGANIIEQLEKVAGLTPEKKKWYESNKNKLKNGEISVPFVIRHNFLYSINNTLQLWQIAQYSHIYQKHHLLTVLTGDISPNYSVSKLKDRVPLLDSISLLILSDLNLLQYIFEVFPQIAISKWTISDLHEWSWSPSFYDLHNSASDALSFLSRNYKRIFQPSSEVGRDQENLIFEYLNYHDRILSADDYLFYSDDAFSRIYLLGENYKDKSICTIDILEHLRMHCKFDDELIASKYALLCSFNVLGTPVYFKDILYTLRSDFPRNLSIEKIIKILDRHNNFSYFVNFLWNHHKAYTDFLTDIGRFISILLSQDDDIRVEPNIIVAFWYVWFSKVQFIEKSELDKLSIISRSFISIVVHLMGKRLDKATANPYRLLWSIYRNFVEFIYGNDMNDSVYRSSFRSVGKQAAALDFHTKRQSISLLLSGLTKNTQDYDLVNNSYIEKIIELNSKKK